ncbi:hypothetical protein [Halobacillus hunanensis]|uniref:hypothetical protein n=1 Tax=Halobacillus hunanensis TaxID=578214 RepID=UPI0009A70D9A|nr:hypothetical protein [Halobacillus hunanensis]
MIPCVESWLLQDEAFDRLGSDIPEGRYQVTNVGRGTNFFVYGSDGYAIVNTILGNENGSWDYVFFTEKGNIIETHGKVKLIPVD